MAYLNAISIFIKAIKRVLLSCALPRIAELPPAEWEDAMKHAREMDFDMIEKTLTLAGIAFTTYLLRFDANEVVISLPIRYLAQVVAAVPLLLIFVGPFYLRCLRRGLDKEIERRQLAE